MFGVGLHEYMSNQSQYIPFLNVPYLVRLCVDAMIQKGFYCWFSVFLTITGLSIEGIFRVPGKYEDIQEICAVFNTG
jgi:hypothetical protein